MGNNIFVTYTSHGGGVNNIAVAIHTITGQFATSKHGKKAAKKNLCRAIKTAQRKQGKGAK